MISRSENFTYFCVGTVQNRENKFLPAGPSPLQSSTKGNLIRETMRFSINRGRDWGMNTVFRLKGQRDANSI
jgi:hypothetical protein